MIKLTKQHQEAIKLIQEIIADKKNQKFLIASHMGPDGDNVGSSMSFYYLLKELNKESITLYNCDPIPEVFKFLPEIDNYVSEIDSNSVFDVAIVVDNSQIYRIGPHWPSRERIKTIIQIDHHLEADLFGDVVYIDEKAPAVGQMLYSIISGFPDMPNVNIATALFTSIVTDTGSFRYSSTSAETFYIAAKLTEAGAVPWKINLNIYENVPAEKIQILQAVLQTLSFNKNKDVAVMFLTQDMLKKFGVTQDIAEGFVNYGRIVEGVKISILLKEQSPNKFKVSIRSKAFDISKIAIKYFNGGGHKHAAGGRVEGKLEELIENIKEILSQELKKEELS